jgi:titin
LARNVIAGNSESGVRIRDNNSDGNKVLGNYLGLTADGAHAQANGVAGVSIGSYDDGSGNGPGVSGVPNTVGGTTLAARNIISGNSLGVIVYGAGTDFNLVQGNYIGTNAAGTVAVPNAFDGVLVGGTAKNTTLSGVLPTPNDQTGVLQIISGNKGAGLRISDSGTDSNKVRGNYIGTNATGTAAIANRGGGIVVSGGTGDTGVANVIGGTTITFRNVISGNFGIGLLVTGAGTDFTQILGNYIGTNAAGNAPLPNQTGIRLETNSLSTNVAGASSAPQVISGNFGSGIEIVNSTSNKIVGNYIGTDSLGANEAGNGFYGVFVNASGPNTVGGTSSTLRNVISANGLDGIGAQGSNGLLIQGNYIGTDLTGTVALGNDRDGVGVFGGCTGVTIGGTSTSARNIISANGYSGVAIYGASLDTLIQANYIGLSFDASAPLGNALDGVDIFEDANTNTVGGPAAPGNAPGNVISANGLDGVAIWDRFSYSNAVQGNIIGTNAADDDTIGNGRHGVNVYGSAGGAGISNLIGGSAANHQNRIRFNIGDGVRVGDSATLVTIRRNSISANGGLGINLQPDGEAASTVTPNDPPAALDSDNESNNLQNFPILTSANISSGTTTIQGTLDSLPSTTFLIEIFSSAVADPSGNGEGQTLLKVLTVVTDANGHATFSTTSALPTAGQPISATATRTDGGATTFDTSEFSNAIPAFDPSFFKVKPGSSKLF